MGERFDTGPVRSGLAYIRALPWDRLKEVIDVTMMGVETPGG